MCSYSFDVKKNGQNCPTDNEQQTSRMENLNSVQTKSNSIVVTSSEFQDIRLRKLLQLMESDPRGKTQNWAIAFNLSNSHLRHLFKRATGMALGQALTEKRLQKAAQLLASTTMSIKQIAYASGYEHTSSFTRAFQKRFEKAPANIVCTTLHEDSASQHR